jgi:hypothetical protein
MKTGKGKGKACDKIQSSSNRIDQYREFNDLDNVMARVKLQENP